MKNKKIIISSIVILFLLCFILLIYHYYRILTAKILVVEKPNKTLEVYDEVHISDLLLNINGKLINDKLLDTSQVGKKEISFDYINDDKIKVSYKLTYKVKDTTPPIIGVDSPYTITLGYQEDLAAEFFCGDNYDNTPTCVVEGEYDTNKVGTYYLKYRGIDNSKNENSANFILNVVENDDTNNNEYEEPQTISFDEIKSKYKNKNTKIGIDVSKWQGNIDFKEVKKSGVEFAMLRVGSEDKDGNLYVDSTFLKNIKGFNDVNIPVGVYYYSYADSIEKATKEAKWVIKQIKKYDIDLPVVFDWENWGNYQEYKLSFHSLTEVADAFLTTIEKEGYKGMLYSSKYYLENIWYKTNYKTWLAHYTDQTNYKGDYYIWQLCSNGRVSGIEDNMVDIDILYK